MSALRLFRAIAVAALALVTTVLVALPATAQNAPYPPQAGPSLTISVTVVVQGNPVTGTGTGLTAGARYTFTVFSQPTVLGTVEANADGTVAYTFSSGRLELGAHRLQLSGNGVDLSQNFTVVAPGSTAAASGGSSSSGGGLAFTGANAVIPMAVVGLLLVLLGGGAIVVARRRGTAA